MAIHPETQKPNTGAIGAALLNGSNKQRKRSNSDASATSTNTSTSYSSDSSSDCSSSTTSSASSTTSTCSTPTTPVTTKKNIINNSGNNKQQQRKAKKKGSKKGGNVNSNNNSNSPKNNTSKKPKKQQGKKQKRHQQKELTPEEMSMYVAMDCEMVGVGFDGLDSALARCTIVGWNGEVLYDQYVKPTRTVTDYRTFVSGITAQHLERAIELDVCRSHVIQILQGRVLVGHALKNDLVALNIHHPWFMMRDTAKYEPFMKVREYDGMACPRKLKELSHVQLRREIQIPGQPHCPYEDAMTALDLYKSVRDKWEAVMDYKVKKTRQIEMQNQSSSQHHHHDHHPSEHQHEQQLHHPHAQPPQMHHQVIIPPAC